MLMVTCNRSTEFHSVFTDRPLRREDERKSGDIIYELETMGHSCSRRSFTSSFGSCVCLERVSKAIGVAVQLDHPAGNTDVYDLHLRPWLRGFLRRALECSQWGAYRRHDRGAALWPGYVSGQLYQWSALVAISQLRRHRRHWHRVCLHHPRGGSAQVVSG